MISRLKIKRRDGLLLAIFYTVVGVLQLSSLPVLDPAMAWIGALAFLSFVAAYGLLRTRKWSVWLIVMLFFPQLTFAAYSLSANISYFGFSGFDMLLLNVGFVVFMLLSFVSFVYVAAKRKSFE